ncbi:hypothetical protein N5079_05265 [Planotetraspora sp. A-T 1434]|uniref:hypothetical protein n=1 Tax=Planotetraspora sp. A-T 1434 TaxID=2979219 RepID=UPI0021BE8A51|nr:hypothetical protein [Planotetraspora sp. A-T 1434]MCT9929627.1 hypothetical protein [Planotetraspora sp. A-T 1434]
MRRLVLAIAACILLTGSVVPWPPPRSVADIARLASDYLASHKNVTRVFRSEACNVTLISNGLETDLSADLGQEISGRLIKTTDASYFQMPLGEEVEAGKSFDKVTDYYEPYHLFAVDVLAMMATNLVDVYRVYEMFATSGTLTATAIEGDLAHYVIRIDTSKAAKGLELATYIALRDPMPLMQKDVEEYDKVREGDRDAETRLRDKILAEFGPSVTYELWVDGQGRPVRYVLTGKERAEMTFSDWGTSMVKAPPAVQVRSLGG